MRRAGPFLALFLILLGPSCGRAPRPTPPSNVAAWAEFDLRTLDRVRTWLYLLDVNLDEATIGEIETSAYDMVVLDFIPSEVNNTEFPMADVIERFHRAPHPKLVLAYLDVGEAEDYRTYWRPGWRIGDPAWILGEDPDGWSGNFPVAYWDAEWADIWLAEDGLIPQVVAARFDGMYLDWIEAYDDDNVIAAASGDEVDPIQAMIHWVQDLAESARGLNPEFLVIGQNAVGLLEQPSYRRTIDAVAQEQIWFDGGAEGNPPGDCPLPRTRDDIETAAYLASLTPTCRRVHDEYPEGTLHTSSQEYLDALALATLHHIPVFTVDYARHPENIRWVAMTSRGYGFVPFVGSRALDRYLEPLP